MDGPYVDERVPNDASTYQKSNTGTDPVSAFSRPEIANPDANSPQFQPSPADINSDLVTGSRMTGQPSVSFPVVASGDLAAGGASGGDERRPTVRGLPDQTRGQAPAHSR
jgi:hypothetical protein